MVVSVVVWDTGIISLYLSLSKTCAFQRAQRTLWLKAQPLWSHKVSSILSAPALQLLADSCRCCHFSRVRLYVTPYMAAHQGPPSLGFSKQEHWSGLPFPSPMHESEKWKWSRSVMSDSSRLHGLQPTRFLHPRDFPGKSTGVGCHCLLHQAA